MISQLAGAQNRSDPRCEDQYRSDRHRNDRPSRFAPAARALVTFILAGSVPASTAAADSPALSFQLAEGDNISSFVREGAVAAHLLLRSGTAPRILSAFPAGDSGAALWFAGTGKPVSWTLAGATRALDSVDERGRPLHGIEAEAIANVPSLHVDHALLSSVRVLRNAESGGTVPAEVLVSPKQSGNVLAWARDRLDGAPGYRLSIEALDGASIAGNDIRAHRGEQLRLRIRAFSGETPLTPLGGSSLLGSRAAADRKAREALSFLSYREKFLAGSWRFDTYFGRDTLISLALLAPVLRPEAVESGLAAVLSRLSPRGEVAHEEEIGEFAVLHHMREGRGRSASPIYDYSMIDEDFLLAPVAASWLLDTLEGRTRARQFLAGHDVSDTRRGEALVRNFLCVMQRTTPFSLVPVPANLVGIKPGRMSGQWRDSDEGLGRGRYPYDVNVVFIPAALRAIGQLLQSGLLDPYLTDVSRRVLVHAPTQARIWTRSAPPLFVVTLAADTAKADIATYAGIVGVDPHEALASLGSGPLMFDALSLDASGRPVPLMHSDEGFGLLLGAPSDAELDRSIVAVMRPFPAGLSTPVGLLITNPAFAGADAQARLSRAAYHGTVIWSWQQAVWVAGLNRQLARKDLPPDLRGRLERARASTWLAIQSTVELRTSELWSWSFAEGCFRVAPFGQRQADEDESNPVQLWSTVFLALPPPRGSAASRAGRPGIHCR